MDSQTDASKPTTMDQIEAEIRECDQAANARRQTALIMVALALSVLGVAGLLAATR